MPKNFKAGASYRQLSKAYDSLADAQKATPEAAAPQTGRQMMGLSRDQRDTPESITSVISFLQTLSETLPGVVQAANHGPSDWIPWTSHGMLFRSVDMLRRYRETQAKLQCDLATARAEEIHGSHVRATIAARNEGIALGIEQEKQRARGVRRARK